MKSSLVSGLPLLTRGLLLVTCFTATVSSLLAQSPVPSAAAQAQPGRPIRVYLRAGLKTHAAGEHDYPQFLADWSKILTERGAVVDGSLHFPTSQELANIDVMVTYKGDAGFMTADEKATLETFLKRGGGLVALHDTICADDPEWFATIYGGAKKHGQVNYTLQAPVAYTIADTAHPIMQGMSDFTITDESFFLMTWAKSPQIKVLATAPQAPTPSARGHENEVVPQIWTYERTIFGGQPFRTFVWMQGHNYVNLTHAQVQPMLLRAIAWAAKAPTDALMTVRPQRTGGRGNNNNAAARSEEGGRSNPAVANRAAGRETSAVPAPAARP